MPQTLKIDLPWHWHPRDYQKAAWEYLVRGGKRAVFRWHRRSGKDDVMLHHTAVSAHRRVGNYWYMLPEYGQARKSMWEAVNPHTGKKRIDEAFPHALRKAVRNQEMVIDLHCGSSFQLVGSDNYNSLVGSPPVGLVFSEYALSDPSAWAYLMPILEENGGWAAFNSTPRGKNHFKALCDMAEKEPGWYYDVKTADETQVFAPDQLQNIRRQMIATHGEAFGHSLWRQEYFVSFDAAIPGSFWGDCVEQAEASGRISDKITYDKALDVHTAWDLGHTDDTAIWFYQVVRGNIAVIDYHASNGKDIGYYGEMLRNRGYRYGTHWLPHDARARTLAAGGKSIQQQMIAQKVGHISVAKRLDHQEGIQAGRATFPRCHFNRTLCEPGLEALKHYHREWDDKLQTFNQHPVHDWSSHAASAFRTLALSWRIPAGVTETVPVYPDAKERHYSGRPKWGALRDEHMARQKRAREGVFA